MKTYSFRDLYQAFAEALSRRGLLTVLSGGLLITSAFPLDINEAIARGHGKHRKKRKRRSRHKRRRPQLPVAPVTRVDATCGGVRQGFNADVGGNTRLAQTFSALASGPLVRADIPISKDAGPEADYILRISPVDGAGVPGNAVLAETRTPSTNLPLGESVVTFTFASPAPVTAGATYALVLTRPGGNKVAWIGQNIGNVCSSQSFFSPDQTAPFDAQGENDLFFTTFVTS